MRAFALALLGASLIAQQPAPEPVVRGVLLDADPGPAGDVSVRVQDNRVYVFRFDGQTTVERNGGASSLMDLRKGDLVEIVPGTGPSPKLRHALQIRVVQSRPAAARSAPSRPDFDALDDLFPRGSLTFAGVVTEIGSKRLVLRTRTRGTTEILLRQDTRFVCDGIPVAPARLRVNERVFIRGTKTYADDIEAYQVMWGDIFQPKTF